MIAERRIEGNTSDDRLVRTEEFRRPIIVCVTAVAEAERKPQSSVDIVTGGDDKPDGVVAPILLEFGPHRGRYTFLCAVAGAEVTDDKKAQLFGFQRPGTNLRLS